MVGRSLACALVLSFLAAGCNAVFDAPKVSLVVQDNRIVFAGPDDAERLVGGETVLRILNDSTHQNEIVLARVDEPDEALPADLIDAALPRDDPRILGMSAVMEPKQATIGEGGVAFSVDRTSFHIHLRRGETYVLFDRLGGIERGVLLYLEPGRDEA